MAKQIKSSIELAMEKMAKLPKLTKDEIRERQEKEYGPQGQAIARDLLTGALAETRLEVELFKHEDERGEIVRKAFSASLCQAIDLEDAETTAKVCNAIKLLVHDDYLEEAASPWTDRTAWTAFSGTTNGRSSRNWRQSKRRKAHACATWAYPALQSGSIRGRMNAGGRDGANCSRHFARRRTRSSKS